MKRRKTSILTKLIIAIIMVYAVATLVELNSKIAAAEAQKASSDRERANLEARNAELAYRIQHANDPDTIQKIAREKLGLVKPGEIIFYRTNS